MLKEKIRAALGEISEREFQEVFGLYKLLPHEAISAEDFCVVWQVNACMDGVLLRELREKSRDYEQEVRANPLFKEFAQPFHKSVFAEVFARRLREKLAALGEIFGAGKEGAR